MSFLPGDAEQQQWLSTVLLPADDELDHVEQIANDCERSVSAAQKQQHLSYQSSALEGRETGESSDSDSSRSTSPTPVSLRAISSEYSSVGSLETPTSVLVLAGSTMASVLHHLGVVLQLAARGRLRHITSIWAEDWGLPLAVLLRLHWTALTCEPVPQPHQLRDLLIDPIVALASTPVTGLSMVWQTHFEFFNRDGVPVLCDIFSRNYGPDITAVLNTLPNSMEYASAVMECVPFAVTLHTFPERLTVRQLLTDLFEAQYAMRTGQPRAAMPHPHSSQHKTLWTAMMNHLGEQKALDRQTLFVISYAGLARPPPADTSNVVPVDASNMTSYWDFQQFMQRVLADPSFEQHSVDYAICTPYGAHDLPNGDRFRQAVNKLYHCLQHYKPVRLGREIVDCVNWGSLVTAETDNNVCRSLGWSVPPSTNFFIPIAVEAKEARASVTHVTQQKVTHYSSQPVLINAFASRTHTPKHHTPCSWLKGVFRKSTV